jgi:hypothetical protein
MSVGSTTVADAQREMRLAYLGGAPGMLTSAAVWLTAGLVASNTSPQRAVWSLLIGGALIHPLSLVLLKALGRSAKHGPENPLGSLALATTFWLVASCVIAYAVSLLRVEWFFPAMLLVIGGRYLTFATVFGLSVYWVCGAALGLAGWALAQADADPAHAAFAGAGLEAVFAATIYRISHREASG